MVGTKLSFLHIGCNIDGRKGTANLALIALLVWQILGKTGGRAKKTPVGRGLSKGGATSIRYNQLVVCKVANELLVLNSSVLNLPYIVY